MSKIMAGIFLGIFTSALFYEIFSRQYPELAEKLNNTLLDKLDISPETGDTARSRS